MNNESKIILAQALAMGASTELYNLKDLKIHDNRWYERYMTHKYKTKRKKKRKR